MTREKLACLLTASVVLASDLITNGQQPRSVPARPPLIRENATVKQSAHVWAIPDFGTPMVPNVGIVVGSTGTMIIDTGLGPKNGEVIAREAAKIRKNTRVYVALTHFHPEHSLGASAFRGAKVVIPLQQQQDMQELGQGIKANFAGRSALNAELLADAVYPSGDVIFDREQRIDLGGVHVRLMWRGPMHTRGDTMMFVEEDRVLFSGDVVMSRTFLAANQSSNLHTWLTTLDELAALKPVKVVPSHGEIGDGSLVAAARDYLAAVQSRVRQLKNQGKSLEDVTRTVTHEMQVMFAGWNGPMRIAGAVAAAYAQVKQ